MSRSGHAERTWKGRSDTVIVRLDNQIRMVTEDYQGGLYDWCEGRNQARTEAAKTKINAISTRGLGSLRKSFHTKKLIDDPPYDKQIAGQKLEREPGVNQTVGILGQAAASTQAASQVF